MENKHNVYSAYFKPEFAFRFFLLSYHCVYIASSQIDRLDELRLNTMRQSIFFMTECHNNSMLDQLLQILTWKTSRMSFFEFISFRAFMTWSWESFESFIKASNKSCT